MIDRDTKGRFLKGGNKGHKPYGGAATRFKKGHKTNVGTRRNAKTKRRLAMQKRGEKNPQWIDGRAWYGSIHNWVKKIFGSPIACAHCGEPNRKRKDGKSLVQWANKSGRYLRRKFDWIPLCPKCHKKYDRKK